MDEVNKILKSLVKGQKSISVKVDKNEKMIRAIINGQSALRDEFEKRFEKVDKRFETLELKMEKGFTEVNDRLDKQGRQLAYLEDDAASRDEVDELDKRVTKVEKKVTSL